MVREIANTHKFFFMPSLQLLYNYSSNKNKNNARVEVVEMMKYEIA